VYMGYYPTVHAHVQALMTTDPAGATTFIQADLHEPEQARTCDLSAH
jgi:hypothetical protein